MADSQESGLARVSRMEKNTFKQGRTGAETPKKMLRGDKNPTSSGGINRPTKGYAKG